MRSNRVLGCVVCGEEFTPSRKGHVSCSLKCNRKKQHLANHEYNLQYNKKYKEENKAEISTALKKWKSENKHKSAMYESKRRANRKNATFIGNEEFYDFFMNEIYGLAKLRSKLTAIKHVVDHVIPLTSNIVCGLHAPSNLKVITWYENQVKYNKLELS